MHRIAVTDSDLIVVNGIEVNGHAIRCSYFVLTAISSADGLRIVVLRTEMSAEHVVNPPSGG